MAQAEGNAASSREWNPLLAGKRSVGFSRGSRSFAELTPRSGCGAGGFAARYYRFAGLRERSRFARGWFESVFEIALDRSVPLSGGMRGKHNGLPKIPAARHIRARPPSFRGSSDRAMDELPESSA